MAELIITPQRNSVIEHFPIPELAYGAGFYVQGYIYLREAVSVDTENALGQLFVCVKTSAIPTQNPGYLTVTRNTVRFGGLVFGASMPRAGFGSPGLLFIPFAAGVGRSFAMDVGSGT